MPSRWKSIARMARFWRWRACLAPDLALVFDHRYRRALPGVPLDPQRGEKVLGALDLAGVLRRGTVGGMRPASAHSLLRVHTAEYLQRLQDPEAYTRAFGLALSETEAESVLDAQRCMSGGTLQAARLALRSGGVAVNLGGGLHHASADTGMGFCLLNDVAVAIAALRAHGYDQRVLVIDLDLHDGNGTRAIFASDASVHTLSIHNQHWGDTEAVEATSIALGPGVTDALYLRTIEDTVPPLIERFRPGLVFYVAGSDPAADDAIGDWKVSEAGLLERDQMVAESVLEREPKRPLVVVLAGGYGPNAWRYPARFLSSLATGRAAPLPPTADLVLYRFRRTVSRMNAAELLVEKDDGLAFTLTEDDLIGLRPGQRQTRFLNLFSHNGVELLFERVGLFEQLRARGFRQLRVDLDLGDGSGHTVRVLAEDTEADELLIELRASRTQHALPGFEVLVVEWLLLQDPRASFRPPRQPLPGQQRPGLGLLKDMLGLLAIVCEQHGLDGVFFTVSHYHLAVQSRRSVRILRPEDEARVDVLAELLHDLPLGEASRAVEDGRVVDAESGTPVGWQGCALVLPVSERLKARVDDPAHAAAVAAARGSIRYRLLQPATA